MSLQSRPRSASLTNNAPTIGPLMLCSSPYRTLIETLKRSPIRIVTAPCPAQEAYSARMQQRRALR